MRNKEIELKFGLLGQPQDLEQVMSTFGKVTHVQTDNLNNVYYDTQDNLLFKAGIGIRIRRGSTKCEQTLKLRGENLGGVHARGEYNLPCDPAQKVPDLHKFPQQVFPESFTLSEVQSLLKPVCEINFARHSFELQALDCVFEVAYDHGQIQVEGQESLPINELEIELIETSRQESEITLIFTTLISALAEHDLPLVLEPFSKMHRATLLRNNNRNHIEFAHKSELESFSSYILKLIKSFEDLYGLFILRHDPLVFGCVIATLHTLVKSLEILNSSGIAAFSEGEREPYNYKDNLKVIISVLRSFMSMAKKFESTVLYSSLYNNQDTLRHVTEDLRELEQQFKIYVIPLKLKVLLGMLIS
ncbi:MAG: CYTH domain-containing protein [Succinivibrio sp.]|nr:CYTH domain-containing protein [Succinivibrio sp.]